MVSKRAKLFAAIALAGANVGPLAAQQPGIQQSATSFEILAPRRLVMPTLPSGGETQEMPVGFFTSPTTQPPAQPNPAPRTQPPQGPTVMPLFGRPQPPVTKPYTAVTAPTAALAWRWHGYGSAASGDPQPSTPHIMTTNGANPGLSGIEFNGPITLPMPSQMPMPPGPTLQIDPRIPAAAPLPSYVPPSSPIEAVPIQTPAGDASWKPSRISIAPTNPMTVDSNAIQQAAFIQSADIARVAFIPGPVAPPPAPPHSSATSEGQLVTLRSTIETICAGRGRDFDMYFRSPNHLLIRMNVRQSADAERLANAISKLPEIAPYHVVFEISVKP